MRSPQGGLSDPEHRRYAWNLLEPIPPCRCVIFIIDECESFQTAYVWRSNQGSEDMYECLPFVIQSPQMKVYRTSQQHMRQWNSTCDNLYSANHTLSLYLEQLNEMFPVPGWKVSLESYRAQWESTNKLHLYSNWCWESICHHAYYYSPSLKKWKIQLEEKISCQTYNTVDTLNILGPACNEKLNS